MKEWSVVVKARVKEEKEVQRWWWWMNIFSGGKGNMIPLLELRKQRICKTTITLSFCFRKDIKEKLKNRGFVYNELYKKDINISKSDGY